LADTKFSGALLDTIARRRSVKAQNGTVTGAPSRSFRGMRDTGELPVQVLKTEQSNTAMLFGDRFFMKLFRRLESGINTDLEVTRFLNDETSFTATPQVVGSLHYESEVGGEPSTIGLALRYVANTGDAWTYTLDSIGRFFENVLSDAGAMARLAKSMPPDLLSAVIPQPALEFAHEIIGAYFADAELLGRRTAQMHRALASRDDIPAFAPEPMTPHYQRSVYQHIRSQAVQIFQLLRRRAKGNLAAEELLAREDDLQKRIRQILDGRMSGLRIRTHGDYHLGQVLHTGNDFVIIDFEGEPSRPLSERRIKRSALRDVAGMLRSFHYASVALLPDHSQHSVIRAEDADAAGNAARSWYRWVSDGFLRAYIAESADAAHLPRTREELQVLLDVHLLEKALYEIAYELNNRPDWVRIPIRGVLDLLGH
jgi:maltose alpha-D-glucosyltransferase/alpha-amylase